MLVPGAQPWEFECRSHAQVGEVRGGAFAHELQRLRRQQWLDRHCWRRWWERRYQAGRYLHGDGNAYEFKFVSCGQHYADRPMKNNPLVPNGASCAFAVAFDTALIADVSAGPDWTERDSDNRSCMRQILRTQPHRIDVITGVHHPEMGASCPATYQKASTRIFWVSAFLRRGRRNRVPL